MHVKFPVKLKSWVLLLAVFLVSSSDLLITSASFANREADILRRILAKYNDPTVYNVGELGLGLNEKNVLCGHMAPDEGSFGNLHIGIGNNLMFGGHVVSPLHMDLVMKKITCDIDGLTIMKDGVLLV